MQSKIERQVMASVGVIYTARRLTGRVALDFYALVIAALALWKLVWVHKVLSNLAIEAHAGMPAVWNYMVVALEHAHTGVLLLLAVAICALVALCVDMARSAPTHTFA